MSACFDRVAPIYDRLAHLAFGERLLIAQSKCFALLPPQAEIAIVGGGSGKILDSLSKTEHPPGRIHYIDASPSMIDLARARVTQTASEAFANSVHFISDTAENWQPDRPLDALLTPFVLDCFDSEPLQRLLTHLKAWLRPGGLWLVSDFAASSQKSHRLAMAAMFAFFRLTCRLQSSRLEDYFDTIAALGFESIERHESSTLAGPVVSEAFLKCREKTLTIAQSPAISKA